VSLSFTLPPLKLTCKKLNLAKFIYPFIYKSENNSYLIRYFKENSRIQMKIDTEKAIALRRIILKLIASFIY